MHIEYIIGYPITTNNLESCVSSVKKWVRDRDDFRYFACANPHSLVMANKDRTFKKSLLASNILTPDGTGILIASRMQGGRIRQRITGSDIFYAVNRMMNETTGGRMFFLGSTESVLTRIVEKLKKDYPNIKNVGTLSPPFKNEFDKADNRAMVEAVNDFMPDILWVGMTAPKQEKWLYQNRHRLNVPFAGAIGAVFDFYIGNIKRSDPLFQILGLEWLPRLIQEPMRLWRRNIISSPLFLLSLIRYRK